MKHNSEYITKNEINYPTSEGEHKIGRRISSGILLATLAVGTLFTAEKITEGAIDHVVKIYADYDLDSILGQVPAK